MLWSASSHGFVSEEFFRDGTGKFQNAVAILEVYEEAIHLAKKACQSLVFNVAITIAKFVDRDTIENHCKSLCAE